MASLAAIFVGAVVQAQETRATLSGTITDPSGASVTGARVSLTNVDTAIRFTAESSALGQYRLLFLNPGKYRASPMYIPPVDAVQELKVTAGAYDAQYGHNGGGVINMTIKGGTNGFHGSVYDFLKRPGLNANSFSNNSKGLPRDNNSLDEYGFSFGGPARIPKVYSGKDRTFFFVAWEHYKQNILFPQNDISSVPTIAQRNGDFSQTLSAAGQLMPVYDPDTGRTVNGNWVRDQFPGNKIPANRFNPAGVKIANLYPEPNTTTAGSVPWQNDFFLKDNITWYDFHNFAARMDHTFSPKERVYGRYVWNNQVLHSNTNGMPGSPRTCAKGPKSTTASPSTR